MKIDTSKDFVFVTLYSDDIGKLISKKENVYTGLKVNGKEIVIDYVACLQCQEKMIKDKKGKVM